MIPNLNTPSTKWDKMIKYPTCLEKIHHRQNLLAKGLQYRYSYSPLLWCYDPICWCKYDFVSKNRFCIEDERDSGSSSLVVFKIKTKTTTVKVLAASHGIHLMPEVTIFLYNKQVCKCYTL